MHRTPLLALLLLAGLAALWAPTVPVLAGCGDLIIPSNSTADAGAGNAGDDDSGGSGDDASRPPPDCEAGVEPVALACTGLYANWTQLTLAPDVQPYLPGATMWVDGADASRWIWLPAGATIDTTDPSAWSFPVGTKLWQELRLLGKRMETRFLWKEAPGLWFRTTFAWADDQSAAPALRVGMMDARGLPYEIPAVSACEKCHDGAADFVLGFEAVGLSMPQSSGLNLQALEQRRLLSKAPASAPKIPGDATTAGALAFLHANCGTSCHNRGPDAGAGQTGLFLKLTARADGTLPATAQQTDTWITSVRVPSMLTPYGTDAGGFWRISPRDVAHSAIPWTMSRRDSLVQMPPIATHLVDPNDVQMLSRWIAAMVP